MHLLEPFTALSRESLDRIARGDETAPQYLLQGFSEDDAHKLANTLKRCPINLLLYLFFSSKSLYAPALAVFLDDLKSIEHLVGLNLSAFALNAACLQKISELIDQDKLNFISIDNCQASYTDIEPVLISAAKSKVLSALTCRKNKIGDKGASRIRELLTSCATLTEVGIANTGITANGGIDIAKGLLNNHSVHSINLSLNPMRDVAVKQICEAIVNREQYVHIKKVSLAYTGLTDDCASAICALLENTHIEELDISGNSFTHVSLKAFVEAAKKSKTIKNFCSSSNRFFPGHTAPHTPDLKKFPEQKSDLEEIDRVVSANKFHL